MNLYLPVALVVLSNTFYHICAKSTPGNVNTFASLTVTYGIGALSSLLLYFLTQRSPNLLGELKQLNWASYVLGICIVGLEAGFLLMYKAGWDVSTGQIVSSAALAVILIFVGYFLYHEALTAKKIIGILICIFGLYLVNG